MKKQNTIYTLLLLCLFFVNQAIAQPLDAPRESRPDLFKFYDPAAVNNPGGSLTVSQAVMLLNNYNPVTDSSEGTDASAFVIKTYRHDNNVCVCLTAHQLTSLFPDGIIPPSGSRIRLNTNVYMNYLGKDSVSNGTMYYQTLPLLSKSELNHAVLLDYQRDAGAGGSPKDAALLLVNTADLPLSSISMLGYDFTNVWTNDQYGSIHHANRYPQRLSDHLTFLSSSPNAVKVEAQLPFAFGPSSSGAPIFTRKPSGAGQETIVRGILEGGLNGQDYEAHQKADDELYYFRYATQLRFTKMRVLESSIRKYCWLKDSSTVESSKSYELPAAFNNGAAISAYDQNASLDDNLDLTISSASLFNDSFLNVHITRLHARECNLSAFTLSPKFPGNNTKDWEVAVAAKEVNIGSNFNYTASGNSGLEVSTVIIGTTGVGSQQTMNDNAEFHGVQNEQLSCTIYPNPSSNGRFTIDIKGGNSAAQYLLQVFTTNGQIVINKGFIASNNSCDIDISNQPSGSYFLVLRNRYTGSLSYRKTITYIKQ